MPYPLPVIRRTSAEILASTILHLFPDTLLIGGELTEIGFAYEFVCPQPIEDQDVPLIEETMRKIIATDEPIQSMEMMRELPNRLCGMFRSRLVTADHTHTQV